MKAATSSGSGSPSRAASAGPSTAVFQHPRAPQLQRAARWSERHVAELAGDPERAADDRAVFEQSPADAVVHEHVDDARLTPRAPATGFAER